MTSLFYSREMTVLEMINNPEYVENTSHTSPKIKICAHIDGDTLIVGKKVTLVANVSSALPITEYAIKWQNNLSGEFRNITGATNTSLSFPASEKNVNCKWRVVVTLTDDVPDALTYHSDLEVIVCDDTDELENAILAG